MKTYIITKVVTARNITEAIKLEKTSEIEAIERHIQKRKIGKKLDTYAIGFNADFSGETEEDDEEYE